MQNIISLRFIGYMGVQFQSLLLPLLIYSLTKSSLAAATLMASDMVFKSLVYTQAGKLHQYFGSKRVHQGFEIGRVISLTIATSCAFEIFGWEILFLSSALFQCCNALSNVTFETLVSERLPSEKRAEMHSKISGADQLSVLPVSLCAFLISDIKYLFVIQLLVQITQVIYLNKISKKLYSQSIHSYSPGEKVSIRKIAKALTRVQKRLLVLDTVYVAIFVAIMTNLPYTLAARAGEEVVTPAILGLFAIGKGLLGFSASQVSSRLLAGKAQFEMALTRTKLVRVSFVFTAIAIFCFFIPGLYSGMGALIGILALICWLSYGKSKRQELLASYSVTERKAATGLLMSSEAICHVLASVMIALSFHSVTALAIITLLVLMLSVHLFNQLEST